jgi:hypothetical protein
MILTKRQIELIWNHFVEEWEARHETDKPVMTPYVNTVKEVRRIERIGLHEAKKAVDSTIPKKERLNYRRSSYRDSCKTMDAYKEIAWRAILKDPAWVGDILDVDEINVELLFDELNKELNPETHEEYKILFEEAK